MIESFLSTNKKALEAIKQYILTKIPSGGLIGITGMGTAGKTTIAEALVSMLGSEQAAIYSFDCLHDPRGIRRQRKDEEGQQITGCHPLCVSTELAKRIIDSLKAGRTTPLYSLDPDITHTKQIGLFHPKKFTIVDGISAMHHGLSEVYDIIIFVECDKDVELKRRLKRDIEEKKSTYADVIDMLTVRRQQFQRYVLPYKELAQVRVKSFADNSITLTFH